MALPNSGSLSMSQIGTEFGKSGSWSLSSLINTVHGGSFADAGTIGWTSNKMSGFYGRKTGGYEGLGPSSGSWVVPNGTVSITCYMAGGGGSGADHYFGSSGPGGGSGGFRWPENITPSGSYAIGSTVNYTVGSGGAFVSPGLGNQFPSGTDSTFGPTYSATGGTGGWYNGTTVGVGGSPNGVNGSIPTGGVNGISVGSGGNGTVFGGAGGTGGGNGIMFIRWTS